MSDFTHYEDIYDYDDDILSQFCYAERIPGDFAQWDVGEHIEDVDGAAAKKAIIEALENGADPVYVSGYVMGYEQDGQPYIYTDCDEQTYEEYYGEPYSA